MSNPYYRDFSDFLSQYFDCKMQKLAINAGMTCPNRDGTVGRGGCTYCNNQSFNPQYCATNLSVTEQIEKGRKFFARKYPSMRYLAYFQAYTNTHGALSHLTGLYEEALAHPLVDGLIIGTRPDCMPPALLDYLSSRPQFIMVEYGAETACDTTLSLINRCHTWHHTVDAVRRTHDAGIPVGLHLIMGLPGEDTTTMLATIDAVNSLPVDVVKIHQLQLLRGTRMAMQAASGEISIPQFSVEEYVELCATIIARLRPGIAIERFVSQSPGELLISPRWGLKNYQFTSLLHNRLKEQRP